MTSSPSLDPDTAERRLSRRTWALVLVVPIIMTAVAVSHHVLTTSDLNPWKGGGFGMFATVDAPGTRRIVTIATLRDGSTYGNRKTGGVLDFNDGSETSLRAGVLPRTETLRSMAREAIFFYQFQIDDPTTEDDDVVSMRVEVSTIDFDSGSRRATLVHVESVDVTP
jgi:hypothetical protein